MDPYIRLTDSYGKSVRTKVKEDAGKHAIFNETLTFLLKDGRASLVKLQCMDEDMLKDSLIAEGTFPVSGLLGGPAQVQLMFKGKLAAELYIKGKLIETDEELEFNKLMKEMTEIEEAKKKKDEPPPPKKEEPPPPKKKAKLASTLDLDAMDDDETPK